MSNSRRDVINFPASSANAGQSMLIASADTVADFTEMDLEPGSTDHQSPGVDILSVRQASQRRQSSASGEGTHFKVPFARSVKKTTLQLNSTVLKNQLYGLDLTPIYCTLAAEVVLCGNIHYDQRFEAHKVHRRNYIHIQKARYALQELSGQTHRGPLSIFSLNSHTHVQIVGLQLVVTGVKDGIDGPDAPLVQYTDAKRKNAIELPPITVNTSDMLNPIANPHTRQTASVDGQAQTVNSVVKYSTREDNTCADWTRIHFMRATEHNGDRRNDQAYYHLILSLNAYTAEGESVTIASAASPRIIVYARSPGGLKSGRAPAVSDSSSPAFGSPSSVASPLTNPMSPASLCRSNMSSKSHSRSRHGGSGSSNRHYQRQEGRRRQVQKARPISTMTDALSHSDRLRGTYAQAYPQHPHDTMSSSSMAVPTTATSALTTYTYTDGAFIDQTFPSLLTQDCSSSDNLTYPYDSDEPFHQRALSPTIRMQSPSAALMGDGLAARELSESARLSASTTLFPWTNEAGLELESEEQSTIRSIRRSSALFRPAISYATPSTPSDACLVPLDDSFWNTLMGDTMPFLSE